MKNHRLVKLLIFGILLHTNPSLGQDVSAQSVEKASKEAQSQCPDFQEQTRAPGVRTQTDYSVETITDKLNFPWGMDFLPDGKLIVSEKPGRIKLISKEGQVGPALKGVPEVRYEGSGGLFDIKLSPDFETSRKVFWTYVSTYEGEAMNQVASGVLSRDETEIQDVKIIYEIKPTQGGKFHFGSRLLFDSEGMLLVTFGDRFRNGRKDVQEMNAALGKIIRITPEGKAAKGNPFENAENTLPEIWSLGHRNPQGLAFNPATQELWESEHGPRAGDEINRIKKGGNYGWPQVSFGLEYDGSPVDGTGLTKKTGMESPVYYYDPAVAPSGMTFYDGDLIPEWKNNLFVAMLRGMHIARLVIDNATGRIVGEERLLTEEKQRFRHVVQGPDDALYAITDDENGRLYRISTKK
ncbi:PQQ-dependent sugar dehydrogenase [Algoriphagus sp. H41]|uniref:PQQ-dependent sugar dehydrogenase n=1 Tax=Algoriphagus oliviformis TaxID=2811231 RepID=A0ABS3C4G1_9BACT|nr:PQQ-dependent sugar dehydrogenase [Algoriphagus oliviformis]MBN7811863.1 PQQ-dependent sugar dehydrogenase [Algoriphagus oliviformis]